MSTTRSIRGRLLLAAAIIAAIVLVVAGWMLFEPGPMDFAGGRRVALPVYTGTNPTGVPAELSQASLVSRGRYLAVAADCAPCHTAAGGRPFAGRFAFHFPFGATYSPN